MTFKIDNYMEEIRRADKSYNIGVSAFFIDGQENFEVKDVVIDLAERYKESTESYDTICVDISTLKKKLPKVKEMIENVYGIKERHKIENDLPVCVITSVDEIKVSLDTDPEKIVVYKDIIQMRNLFPEKPENGV